MAVSSLSPPPFDLYEPFGLYDGEQSVMRFEAIEEAKKTARIGNLSPENEMRPNDGHPEVRAQNLDPGDICREGALFNAFWGPPSGGSSLPTCPTLARHTWCSTCGLATG